jgi:hypothetical protein
MLSAINWNACPQSIGIAVRDRWNAAGAVLTMKLVEVERGL